MPVTIIDQRPYRPGAARGTVLFADLRGYTTLAERVAPHRIVSLLAEFFALLGAVVEHHGGRVYHVAGDSLMAGFGVARDGDRGAAGALAAGRSIVREFDALARHWEYEYEATMGVGIGIHHGELAVGELGPPACRSITLIGDTVNVAARLCARARAGEVLFSAAVAHALDEMETAGVVPLPAFMPRGRSSAIEIYCLPARDRVDFRDVGPAGG